jgi:tRNA pseudouridine32 synthase/23S rRNA pseudouridine746 synthase
MSDNTTLLGGPTRRLRWPSLKHQLAPTKAVAPPPSNYHRPHPEPLETIWSDPWLIAVNKPANELSVPGKAPLDKYSTQQRTADAHGAALVIHRLDGATSGILLFARNAWMQKCMHKHFRQRWVHKTYCAIVSGHLAGQSGTIQLPLVTDWVNRPRQHLNWQAGKPSMTHWQKRALGFDTATPATRLSLTPVTGRTHQLRVHLLALGHPIVGDRLYHPEPTTSVETLGLKNRLHLHASALSFRHPLTGEQIDLQVPTPF